MHFYDVAKDLSQAYPQAGLLVASTPQAGGASTHLEVLVLSQLNARATAIAVVESEHSLEAGPGARWHWFSLLGLPLDIFVPASRLEDARRLAAEARLRIRGLVPYTLGVVSPPSRRPHHPGRVAPAALTGAVEATGALSPTRAMVAKLPYVRNPTAIARRRHAGQ
ncbi:MAG: hypothetical protein HYY01_09730 [Chloroflexi bacterium]|nr:hypothetical protein [Chloroflexota bacterium]